MDPTTYNDIWVNLATNSPFLGWMIYSYIQTNKFEKVITELNTDRTQLVEGLTNRISSLERGQKKIFHLLGELSEVKDKITKIEMKEQIIKEIQ